MKSSSQDIDRLCRLIRLELSNCDPDRWPQICRLQSTEAGYARIESHVLRLATDEGAPVGAAIAQLEQELSHAENEAI